MDIKINTIIDGNKDRNFMILKFLKQKAKSKVFFEKFYIERNHFFVRQKPTWPIYSILCHNCWEYISVWCFV
ncbi:MAG: hypothetical protein A2W99_05405 [Bacteroidetes bacterium GWF2_33_16]|nr:MAG: hypothetical protein A2W99_05405 [Bacteroidetes bacterium GWF2_33_16]